VRGESPETREVAAEVVVQGAFPAPLSPPSCCLKYSTYSREIPGKEALQHPTVSLVRALT